MSMVKFRAVYFYHYIDILVFLQRQTQYASRIDSFQATPFIWNERADHRRRGLTPNDGCKHITQFYETWIVDFAPHRVIALGGIELEQAPCAD